MTNDEYMLSKINESTWGEFHSLACATPKQVNEMLEQIGTALLFEQPKSITIPNTAKYKVHLIGDGTLHLLENIVKANIHVGVLEVHDTAGHVREHPQHTHTMHILHTNYLNLS